MKFLVVGAMLLTLYHFGKRLLTPAAGMPRAEAARLLGVKTNADTAAILEAHRRLIAKVHPDAGGSEELASRINQARDVLLSR